MSSALVKPLLLRWARERAGMKVEALADSLGTAKNKILAWEEGKALPTFKQAQKIAHKTHIPFGYLFLLTPPEEIFPLPDLRTIAGRADMKPSLDFRDLVSDITGKRDWYLDYLRDIEASPLPYVGKFTRDASPKLVAEDIAKTLQINDSIRRQAKSWEEFLSTLILLAEKAGILVMRSSIVGNNTHRPLSVEEFRGFAISDTLAPLVFINSKDAKAAQMFTFAHELAHIWIGESGVSNLSLERRAQTAINEIEVFCNQVAVELLVPQDILIKKWDNSADINSNANNVATYFRVSSVVVARRAFDIGLIDSDTYWNFYEGQKRRWREEAKKRKESKGGDPYLNFKSRNGTLFSSAVISSLNEGNLLYRDAASLLNIKPGNLKKFATLIQPE